MAMAITNCEAVIVDEREPIVPGCQHIHSFESCACRLGSDRTAAAQELPVEQLSLVFNPHRQKAVVVGTAAGHGHMALDEKQCKGYEAYMEGRVLELGRPAAWRGAQIEGKRF